MWNLTLFIILFVGCLLTEKPCIIDAAKILGVVVFPCHSHVILCRSLLHELAKRGHEVTLISAFPQAEKVPNFVDIAIDVKPMRKIRENGIVNADKSPLRKVYSALRAFSYCSEVFLSDKKVKELIATREKYDLVISLNVGAVLGLSHSFNASTILFVPYSTNPYYAAFNKIPLPSSYVPNFMSPHSDEMGYLERVMNTIVNLFFDFYINSIWVRTEDEILQKHFPGAPHVRHLHHNIKLELHNSHMTVDNVRPFLTNAIQIGGFNLDAPEELSNELKTFLDTGTSGVILFSLGTGMTAQIMGDKINVLLNCFGSLPYKVLWKNEGNVDGQPSNVKTMKWIPQKVVLSHPNVKLFITHGGHGSVQESIYNSVPMIIIPFCMDQQYTAMQSERDGYAIHLDVETLTEKTVLSAISDMMTRSSYYEEISLRAHAMRNQVVKPMQKAIFWIERVIKQKNATYLNCAGNHMPLNQYYLFDSYPIIFLSIMTVICIFGAIGNLLINIIRRVL